MSKKLFVAAGINDCYTSTRGKSKTLGNYVRAIYYALANTYQYLSPDMWPTVKVGQSPYQQWSDFLKDSKGNKGGYKKGVEA